MTFLQGVSPERSLGLFTVKRYGNRLGIPVVCIHCGDRPPLGTPQHIKWRWMTMHMADKHNKQG